MNVNNLISQSDPAELEMELTPEMEQLFKDRFNGGDWRSKSLALPFMFSTTLDGFYFANCVLAAVFFLFDFQHFIK